MRAVCMSIFLLMGFFVCSLYGCMTPQVTISIDGENNTVIVPQSKTVTTDANASATIPLI